MIVENDAAIARALQEELSRIAAAEGSGVSNTEQELIITQQWPGKYDFWNYTLQWRLRYYSFQTWVIDILSKMKNWVS